MLDLGQWNRNLFYTGITNKVKFVELQLFAQYLGRWGLKDCTLQREKAY